MRQRRREGTPGENGGRECRDAPASQGTPRVASNHPEEERVWSRFSLEPPEGTCHVPTMILDYWSSELQENKFLLF